MFAQINNSYFIALIYFAVTLIYSSFIYPIYKSRNQFKQWREYLSCAIFLLSACISYGLLIITVQDTLRVIFWAVGFSSLIIFVSVWIRFASSMITIKNNFLNRYGKIYIIFIAIITALICIIYLNPVFVFTPFGTQYIFTNTFPVVILLSYNVIYSITLVFIQIQWLKQSKLKRQKKQQTTFLFLSLIVSPLGAFTDFIVPSLNNINFTMPPLLLIIMVVPSLQLFLSLLRNNTMSITIDNVSKYLFKSVNMPIIVLDNDNIIKLINNKAATFIGKECINQNIDK